MAAWSTNTRDHTAGRMRGVRPGVCSPRDNQMWQLRNLQSPCNRGHAPLKARNDVTRHGLTLGFLLVVLASLASCSSQQRFPSPPVQGDSIVVSLASLPLEVPQFYSYRTKGTLVNFFIIRMQDRVLSFLDACLTCYPRKLGYASHEGFVVCRACDTHYSIYKLEKGIGGCFPIRIEGIREGDSYRIARSTFDRHSAKF